MPGLTLPGVEMRTSFVEAMREFQAEGRGQEHDRSTVGDEIRDNRWATPEGFSEFVADLRAKAVVEPPPGRVRGTTWWWCEGTTYLGRIALRHELTESLRKKGGHVGYDVRPTARRQGHATAMLAAVLPKARELGIDRALITCDEDNIGSRRVIEANGGVLEFAGDGIRRYWLAT
ncbi:GNAT family N-acetyltransferase [Kutzneria kofuensis]|uniref:Putative acetyltransferase n=1 Tax=Kutzneria kofuensis TaxID=103725 RepID=A0A7W9KJY4_9PSEU|nr:GNAT family N-acetyltransferase [Kutzneria kofuensis]MBB5893968.1 putative acetyltransferase [Kutzneria kofuensis]